MRITKTFIPENVSDWRAWLEANHDAEQEIWLVYFKAPSHKTGIDYETSVEEALCFGWVDSLIQKIDEEKYARKFNPRRADSHWSESNLKRMEKLIGAGRVRPGGLAKFASHGQENASGTGQKDTPDDLTKREEILWQLETHPFAWQAFQHLPPSHQREYMLWIVNAKKMETRQKRLAEVITRLEEGKKPGQK